MCDRAATSTSQVTTMTDSISAARAELAPTGTLCVALNMSNFLLTATDPVTGEPCGLAKAETVAHHRRGPRIHGRRD